MTDEPGDDYGFAIMGDHGNNGGDMDAYIIKTDDEGINGCEDSLDIEQVEMAWDTANYGQRWMRGHEATDDNEESIDDEEEVICTCE